MEAKDIVLAARKEYLEQNQDEQFKKAFDKVEALRVEADDEVEELKGYEPNDDLTNYVFNKLLEKARKEGGNVFMGESKDIYEYIFEFYTDYENLKDQFEDKWSQYIRYVSNTSQKPKAKKKSVSDTLEDADALAAKEKKLEEEFKKKEEALKKAAIKEYKEAEAKKKEEAKLKAEEEKKRKEEEAKRKEQEESESLGGLFDLL